MEFWESKLNSGTNDDIERVSSDDDDILKHVQNLDIGDNFMDDDDHEESYDTEERPVDTNSNVGNDGNTAANNGDYPDDLSDISDLFEGDAHLLSLDIGLSNGAVSKNRETQMLSLDEVPYSRDLKWINTPEDDRPKPRISKTSNRFLKQVQGITSQNHGELNELDRHYKGLDQKKRDFDLSGPPGSRDRRRGRTSGSLIEVQYIAQSEPLVDGPAARGPGKLVIFDDDPKPSQRRKRPYRTRQPRGDLGSDKDPRDVRGEMKVEQRGDSNERRDRGVQQIMKNGMDGSHQHSRPGQRTNTHTQHPRLLTHDHSAPKQERQQVIAIQTRGFNPNPTPRPYPATSPPATNNVSRQQAAPRDSTPPVKLQLQHTLISETNAIKLRADAPVWTPPAYAYT